MLKRRSLGREGSREEGIRLRASEKDGKEEIVQCDGGRRRQDKLMGNAGEINKKKVKKIADIRKRK